MKCDKIYTTAGATEGQTIELAIDTYFVDASGQAYTKKPQGVEVESRAKIGLILAIPAEFAALEDGLIKMAALHSYTRKAQEGAKVVRDGDTDPQVFVDTFPTEKYPKIMAGERERGFGGAKVDSFETLVNKYVANLLQDKLATGKLVEAKVAVPRLDNPPKTEKGKINFIAWAKILREEDYPWVSQATKKLSGDKGFD